MSRRVSMFWEVGAALACLAFNPDHRRHVTSLIME